MGFSKYNISFLPRCLLGIVITLQCSRSFCDDEAKPKADEPVPVDAAAAAKEAEAVQRKARVDFLVEAIKHFEVRVGEDRVESKLNPKPLLVWNNPVSGTRIGILAMFSRNDRPDVIAQFSFNSPTTVINEFHNFYGTDLEMKRGESTLWTPSTSSTKWNELPNADIGAETPQQRLIQMRRLAESFVVEDNFGWDKKELNQLRLLPTPVYRYGNPADEVVDGAVFVYALGTDPEAILILECVKKDEMRGWRYSVGPMSIYPITAKLGDEVVYEIGERKQFGVKNSVQYVCPYQLADGEKIPE